MLTADPDRGIEERVAARGLELMRKPVRPAELRASWRISSAELGVIPSARRSTRSERRERRRARPGVGRSGLDARNSDSPFREPGVSRARRAARRPIRSRRR